MIVIENYEELPECFQEDLLPFMKEMRNTFSLVSINVSNIRNRQFQVNFTSSIKVKSKFLRQWLMKQPYDFLIFTSFHAKTGHFQLIL